MTDKDLKTIFEKIESLHDKILKSRFAETVTESEMMSLVLAVRLLSEQQAEIERLQKKVEELSEVLSESIRIRYKEAKSEAVKEFAEKLNDRIVNFPSVYPIESATLAFLNGSAHRQLEILEIIDNLVKEMVGEDSGQSN